MEIVIYILAVISILLAIGGLSAYGKSKQPTLLVSSLVSIGFSVSAISLASWWSLLIGFAINLLLSKASGTR